MGDVIEVLRKILATLKSFPNKTQANMFGSVVAFATGGQTNATPLTAYKNLIITAANNNDSVLLISADYNAVTSLGATQVVQNRAGNGNAVNVYPQSGQNFSGSATNVPFSLTDGNDLVVNAYSQGTWTF